MNHVKTVAIQLPNIEAFQGNEDLRFFCYTKANDLRPMGHDISGVFPRTEPTLFWWPHNIAEKGANLIGQCGQDCSAVAEPRSHRLPQKVTQSEICGACDTGSSNY
jgi:hypothetical protein